MRRFVWILCCLILLIGAASGCGARCSIEHISTAGLAHPAHPHPPGCQVPLVRMGHLDDFTRPAPDATPTAIPEKDMQGVAVGSLATEFGYNPDEVLNPTLYELAAKDLTFEGIPSDNLEAFRMANQFVTPAAGQPAYLMIASPVLQSGQFFQPMELWRDGNTFTLIIEHWYDTAGRLGNIPHRSCDLVSLGVLTSGNYRLRIEWRVLETDFSRDKDLGYRWEKTRFAEAPFEVKKPPPFVAPFELKFPPAAWVKLPDSLPDAPAPQNQSADLRLCVPYRLFRIESSREFDRGNIPVAIQNWLRLGAFNPEQWMEDLDQPISLDHRPHLDAPEPGDQFYAMVICPLPLASDELATLRSVRHKGTSITLEVDVVRTGKEPAFYGAVLVCLNEFRVWKETSDVLRPGTYSAQVEWHFIGGGKDSLQSLSSAQVNLLQSASGPITLVVRDLPTK